MTCSGQMGMYDVIQCMCVMHIYVCGVTGESHMLSEVVFRPCADRFLATSWIFQAMLLSLTCFPVVSSTHRYIERSLEISSIVVTEHICLKTELTITFAQTAFPHTHKNIVHER